MGKKNKKSNNNGKQTQDLQNDNNSEEKVELNLQDDNNSEEKVELNLQNDNECDKDGKVNLQNDNNSEERSSINTDDLKQENDVLRLENSRLEDELKTLKKELEEQRLRIEGLTKLELLLKIKENLKNKSVEIVNEKNKFEEVNKLGENSTEKIVVEKIADENKVEIKKPQNKRLNPFFRKY